MIGAQFWSAYTHADSIDSGASLRHALRGIDQVHRLVANYPEALEFARSADDIEDIFARGRIASLIGVEGGHAIQNSLAVLRQFYALGVRYMTLSHNRTIDWVDSATEGVGAAGPITLKLREVYLEAATGKRPEYEGWLTYVTS